MSIPTTVAPIFYDQNYIASIQPQLDELIAYCDSLLSEAQQTVQEADRHIELANTASDALRRPLELYQRARRAEYQMRELRARAGIAYPKPSLNVTFGHCTIQGRRATNEDAHAVFELYKENRHFTVAAVFDGHAGDYAAKFCGENYQQLLAYNEMFPAAVASAVKTTFYQLDRQFLATCKISGCTAVTAVFEHGQNTLTCGNAGDARAICGTRTAIIECTHDHKPNQPEERRRIEAAGSFVTTMFGVPRVNGMLAVSRAIGDDEYKQFGVISEPEVWEYEEDELCYIVVACDGLFDVLSNEDVDCIVRACFNIESTGDALQSGTQYAEYYEPAEYAAATSYQLPMERRILLERAAKAYMEGDIAAADRQMLENAGMSFVNFKVVVEPSQTMTREDRCACILTRIAYLLGSTDNVTCLVGVVDEL